MSRRDSREAAINIIFQNTFTDNNFGLKTNEKENEIEFESISESSNSEDLALVNDSNEFDANIDLVVERYIESILEEGIKIPTGYDEETQNIIYEIVSMERSQFEIEYIKDVIIGVAQNLKEIDNRIIKFSKDWSADRMSKVDLAILRVAIYELLYKEDIPASVTVNEAVEIAKKYSHDDAGGFIHGILGSVYRESNT